MKGERKSKLGSSDSERTKELFDSLKQRKWSDETRLERAGKRQTVYNIIHRLHSLKLNSLEEEAGVEDISGDELKGILNELTEKGLVYSPKRGYVGCVED